MGRETLLLIAGSSFAVALLARLVAKRKGYDPEVWFILSFIFLGLPLLVLLVRPSRKP